MTFRARGRPLGLRGAGLGAVIAMATTLSVSGPACDTLLVGGLQVGGVCENGATRCADDTPETCRKGAWDPDAPCEAGKRCRAGVCIVDCNAGDLRCFGNTPQTCVDGSWQSKDACAHQTCILGACTGECGLGDATCSGKTPQVCDPTGKWQNLPDCAGECIAGSCPGPSCADPDQTQCGPTKDENCCLSPLVSGGSFYRGDDQRTPATVSDFRLDRFEITVGRFWKYWKATGASPPAPGAGAHPLIPGSGWDPTWNDKLSTPKEWKCDMSLGTWVDPPQGINARRPMNCLNWYDVFAFCAWDGGRLPTEAEWEYAAAGGGEQRTYPWGDALPDLTLAEYDCGGGGCSLGDIAQVGPRSPAGDGKWRQADLAGGVWEWVLDAWVNSGYTNEVCVDCADTQFKGHARVLHGGSWYSDAPDLRSSVRLSSVGTDLQPTFGARCARSR